jgi:penicillin-binding protein 1A
LGAADLSLYELVSAYTTFANEGFRIDPVYVTHIIDRNGKTLRQHRSAYPTRAMSYTDAATLVRLLQGVVEEGSAQRLRSEFKLSLDIAGKTGTSQEQADGWFIGITPYLVTGVWVGAENPVVHFRSLELGQGSHTALPVWGDFMSRLAQDRRFRHYRYSRFRALPPELEARLDCGSLREEPPPMVVQETHFIDRLLDRISRKRRDDGDDWEKDHKKERKREEKFWKELKKLSKKSRDKHRD